MQREIWVTHQTIYEFDTIIDGAVIRARLRPLDNAAQTVVESEVHGSPRPIKRHRECGPMGVAVDRLEFDGPLRRIEIAGQSRVRWDPTAVPRYLEDAPAELGAVPSWALPDGEIWNWARRALPDSAPGPLDVAAFADMIRGDFTFDARATEAATPVPRFFRARRGVCQDYAGLAAGCLVARGVPVRLVFGYLVRQPDGGHRFEDGQPHAWLSTWDPASGWHDVDPTTGLAPPANHITLLRGRQLRDVQPVAGRLRGPSVGQRLSVYVTVAKDTAAQ